MRCTVFLLAMLLAGCSAHTQLRVGAETPVPHSGLQVHVEGGRGLAALFGLSILAAGIYEMEYGGLRYRGSPFVTISDNSPQSAPELAPDRIVVEHDCTRPIGELTGNLRCR
jgi:hypothetical protein